MNDIASGIKKLKMANLINRTIYCHDNLDILKGINSNSIDFIYLDPPFNKKKTFTAPIGSSAEGAGFKDIFKKEDVKDEWVFDIQRENYELYALLKGIKEFGNHYNYCYSVYMAIRLIEIWRILKPTGNVCLHCDQTMSHYLKLVMDCIFGEKNFRNEIIWKGVETKNDKNKVKLPNAINNILFYCKNKKAIFNPVYTKLDDEYIVQHYKKSDSEGRYMTAPLHAPSYNGKKGYTYEWDGVKRSDWIYSRSYVENLDANNKIYKTKRGGYRKKVYLYESLGKPLTNMWTDLAAFSRASNSKERTRYPTQKPLSLLERIINMCSNEGDMVLDPFCGCATTCIAAEKLGRKWVGIDVSQKAYDFVKDRLKKIVPADSLAETEKGKKEPPARFRGEPNFTTTPPKRTDMGVSGDVAGYIYIISHPKYKNSLKVGIAKNPDARLKQYQTGDPKRQYKMEKKFQTRHNVEIEKMIHEHYQAPTEWVATGDIDEVFNLIKQFDKKISQMELFEN